MFKLLLDHLESLKNAGTIPYKVHEGSEIHLLSLMEAIRVQRNDAVHPATAAVSKRSVWLTLIAFPAACRKVYDLIDWLQANKI